MKQRTTTLSMLKLMKPDRSTQMKDLTSQGIRVDPIELRPKHRLKPALRTSEGQTSRVQLMRILPIRLIENRMTMMDTRQMYLEKQALPISMHSSSNLVKLDSRLLIAIMQTNRKQAFLLFIFNLIGYEIRTATIQLALIIIRFLVTSLPKLIYAYPALESLYMNCSRCTPDKSKVQLAESQFDESTDCSTYLQMSFSCTRLASLFRSTPPVHRGAPAAYFTQPFNLELVQLQQIHLNSIPNTLCVQVQWRRFPFGHHKITSNCERDQDENEKPQQIRFDLQQPLQAQYQRSDSPQSQDDNGGPSSKLVTTNFAQVNQGTDVQTTAEEPDSAESKIEHEIWHEKADQGKSCCSQQAHANSSNVHVDRAEKLAQAAEEEEIYRQ